MSTRFRTGLLLSPSVLASFAACDWSLTQTEFPEASP